MLRNVRVMFVSREMPLQHVYGSGAYVMDILRYLHRQGCNLEFVLLAPISGINQVWTPTPRLLSSLAHITAFRGRVLPGGVLSWPEFRKWPRIILKLLYSALPEFSRRLWRSWRAQWIGANKRTYSLFAPGRTVEALPTPSEIDYVRERVEQFGPQVVVANYAWLGPLLRDLPNGGRLLKVIVTHDVLHERAQAFESRGLISDHHGWTSDAEGAALAYADLLLAIQSQDAEALQRLVPAARVLTMHKSELPRTRSSQQVDGRCLFVGSAADHNVLGLQWFLQDIWPLVISACPGATMHVVGTVCHAGIRKDWPNVRLIGPLENLDHEYGQAQACLVPLQSGSGLKIKLVEALAYGRACVATSAGVQGLSGAVASAVLVADEPDMFARSLVDLFSTGELRRSMEASATEFVRNFLSPERVYGEFLDQVRQHAQARASLTTDGLPV
jgi:hypothetical protein